MQVTLSLFHEGWSCLPFVVYSMFCLLNMLSIKILFTNRAVATWKEIISTTFLRYLTFLFIKGASHRISLKTSINLRKAPHLAIRGQPTKPKDRNRTVLCGYLVLACLNSEFFKTLWLRDWLHNFEKRT